VNFWFATINCLELICNIKIGLTTYCTAWVRTQLCRLQKGCTQLATTSDKFYQLLAHGRWFSLGAPASSTTKTGIYTRIIYAKWIFDSLLLIVWNWFAILKYICLQFHHFYVFSENWNICILLKLSILIL
jgi:hypothetical protein